MPEYRVDELARLADTTTRNVRAYQDRGLIAPPEIRGRTGYYSDTHLARLRLINSLLRRGFTIAQISQFIEAWEEGKDIGETLGLEQAVMLPWTDELPTEVPTAELRALLDSERPGQFDRVADLGLFRVDGERTVILLPRVLTQSFEVLQDGFALDDLIGLYERVSGYFDDAANQMVRMAVDRLTAEHGEGWLPDKDQVPELAEMLRRLRRMALSSMHDLLAHALERATESVLEEHLTRAVKNNE
ncbi:MerR family transcriptional regulator [Pseudonocardiaceae bacterium YIM PH 21723]|nr:MerR family transcriptional regulator [Pseudonocardiaceae bacterium YIM PH 21723]